MSSLSQLVELKIQKSPFVAEAMEAQIVNISSLARYLKPYLDHELQRDIKVPAIVMAIKRLPPTPNAYIDKSIDKFMKQLGDINVRSNLADITYRNSVSLLRCQGTLLSILQEDNSHFYSTCKGVHETTIICSDNLIPKITDIFTGEQCIATRQDLAAVSIKLPPINLDTYGVYYTILKRLAWKGINLVEVLSTAHEISLVVSSRDIRETFAIILDLKKED